MDRVKDASEGGIEAATVPSVGALLRAHIPKHDALKQKCLWAAESLVVCLLEQGCWAKLLRYLPDSTLGVGTVPAARGLGPTEISPVNVSVNLGPSTLHSPLVAAISTARRMSTFRGAEPCSEA
jgi:hypothetical protein